MFNLEKDKMNSTQEVKNSFNQAIIMDKEIPPWAKNFNPSNKIENNNHEKDWFKGSLEIGSLTVEERQQKLYSLRESFVEKKEEKLKLEKELSEVYVKYLSGEVLLEKYNEVSNNKIEKIQNLSQEMKEIRQEFKNIKEYTQMENVINEKETRFSVLTDKLNKKYDELKLIKDESTNLMQKIFIGEVNQEKMYENKEKFENIISDIKDIKKEMMEIKSFIAGQDFPNKVISINLDKVKGEEISKNLEPNTTYILSNGNSFRTDSNGIIKKSNNIT